METANFHASRNGCVLSVSVFGRTCIEYKELTGVTTLSQERNAAGPLFAVVLGAAALGASLMFSTAAFFILVPLALVALPLTFGLFAGAFVLKGLAFTAFNLVSASQHLNAS